MSTRQFPHQSQHRHATMHKPGSRLGRAAAVLAAVTVTLMSFASAAFASGPIPLPGPGGQYGTVPGGTATVTRVITAGGMAGWQIALIAVGAALVAAAAAVILDRALARRRPIPAMIAR